MYVLRYLTSILVILSLGCSSAGDERPPVSDPDFPDRAVDDIYLERFALEDFQNRLEASITHFQSGNRFLFFSTRDSLVSDVNLYLR
ncbi:MAG: hypothetical protein GY771_08275, partial [bacterium]|nr:hypothetical protein [bacterium]